MVSDVPDVAAPKSLKSKDDFSMHGVVLQNRHRAPLALGVPSAYLRKGRYCRYRPANP
jgi:hypothetical protein